MQSGFTSHCMQGQSVNGDRSELPQILSLSDTVQLLFPVSLFGIHVELQVRFMLLTWCAWMHLDRQGTDKLQLEFLSITLQITSTFFDTLRSAISASTPPPPSPQVRIPVRWPSYFLPHFPLFHISDSPCSFGY